MTKQMRLLAVFASALAMIGAAGIAAAGDTGGGTGGKTHCNSGRGNGSESPYGGTAVTGEPNDCDPGNSADHNHGGDFGGLS